MPALGFGGVANFMLCPMEAVPCLEEDRGRERGENPGEFRFARASEAGGQLENLGDGISLESGGLGALGSGRGDPSHFAIFEKNNGLTL